MTLLECEDRLTAIPVRLPYPYQSNEWKGQRLIELAAQAGCRTLEINFSAVDYVTAEDLGSLLAARNRVNARGGRLVLSCMNELVREIFAITRLDRTFKILADDEPDADPFDLIMTQSDSPVA